MQSSSQIITPNKPTSSFFYRTDALPVAQPTVSKARKRKISHSMNLLTPKLTWGLSTLSLTTDSSWLPWGRVAMSLISPLMSVPQSDNSDHSLAVWCSGNALVSINAVALHQARLVLGWVTAFGQVNCLIT